MMRTIMIKELKTILPYKDSWYLKLTDAQVYAIWYKYMFEPNKFNDAKINDYCNNEQPKVLVKRKIENKTSYILADNGNWEEEID